MVGAPLLAGLIVAEFGFVVLFLVAVGLLLGSLVPLFLMPHHLHTQRECGFGDLFSVISHKPTYAGSVFFWNVAQATTMFFWPVYLYLVIPDFSIIGVITSVAMCFLACRFILRGKCMIIGRCIGYFL